MTTGLQIVNDAGTILIDENYTNLALRLKGTVTLDSDGVALVAVAGLASPVVAVRCTTAQAYGELGSGNTSLRIRGNPGASVTYYIFDTPVGSGLHQGLQVFNAAGVLCFDSGRSYARVRAAITGDIRTAVGTYTYDSGRTYAVAFPTKGRVRDWDSISSRCPPDQFKYRRRAWDGAAQVSGSSVILSFWQWRNETSYGDCTNREPKIFNSYPFAMMVLDVTGY